MVVSRDVFTTCSSAEVDRAENRSLVLSPMSTVVASRKQATAPSAGKEGKYYEVLAVRVEISTTRKTVGMFVITCAIKDVVAGTTGSPDHELADWDCRSSRRYNFCYPHKHGTPRTIGLSGDMLDLASQTTLGSEHSWRIRTKGSRRSFCYEIEVDQRAGHAELIVDGRKERLVLPWVPLEEDFVYTSRKADEQAEKTQDLPSEEDISHQPSSETEKTGTEYHICPISHHQCKYEIVRCN